MQLLEFVCHVTFNIGFGFSYEFGIEFEFGFSFGFHSRLTNHIYANNRCINISFSFARHDTCIITEIFKFSAIERI